MLRIVRPFIDSGCHRTLDALRRRGVRLIADFDDLLFAGDPAEHPLAQNGTLRLCDSAARLDRYRQGLAEFDAFTVSTEPLREHLLEVLPDAKVHCVPNGLSRAWIDQGRLLYPSYKPGDAKVVRFFAGSPSHDANFALIAPVLGVFMWAHQDVRLEVVGHVTLPEAHLPAGRVRHVPALPFDELPRLLGSSWVTLAPVASTTFNRCKSAIKFLESAAFGAPCIATSSWDMARHRDGGVMLADDEAAWLEALNALCDDDVRMTIGTRGRQYVDRHGDANGPCLLRGVADV